MSLGTQSNGLPIECTFDTIGMHHFGDSSTWENGLADSSWIISPSDISSPFNGKVVKLIEMQIDLSEDIVFHSGGQLLVQFFMNGIVDPVLTYTYENLISWINRSDDVKKVDMSGSIGPFLKLNVVFAKPPILWSTAGLDAEGSPKLNKMIVKIADDQPYKNTSGSAVALANGRYFVEIYNDPDVA